MQHSPFTTHGTVVALGTAILLSACGGDSPARREDSAAATATTAVAPTAQSPGGIAGSAEATPPAGTPTGPPPPPARDADQRFLRRMLDHHEAVIALAHEAMMAPEGHGAHGTATDPSATDAYLDAEKLEMLRLLDSLYGEQYSPRPTEGLTSAEPAGDDEHAGDSAAAGEVREQRELAAAYRAGVALVDEAERELRRPAVRTLAARMRRTQAALLSGVTSVAPAPSH